MSRANAETFVKSFFEIIEEELLKGELVKIKGFGAFKTLKVEKRESIDINTGERILIDEYVKVSFTPDANLKEQINKPFSGFETIVLSDYQAEMISDSVESEEVEAEPVVADPEAVAVEEPVAEEPVTEPEAVEEPVAEEPVAEEPVEESVTEPEVEPEAMAVEEPVAEEPAKENIEESAASNDAEVAVNKPVIGKGKRRGFKAVITVATIVLVLLLLIYMLWPLIFQYYIKHQYKESRKAVKTEQVVTESSAVIEMADVESESEAEPVAEEPAEEPAVAEKPAEEQKPEVQKAEKPAKAVEERPAAVVNPAVKQIVNLVAEDEMKDLADFTADDTDNYAIVGLLAEHTLQKDEILTILSQKYYGTKKLWPYIAKYNNFDDFNKLRPGMKVLIPKLENK